MIFVGYSPINEAYFGKTPEVLAIEKGLSVIRKKYEGEEVNKPKCKKIVNTKEWKELTKSIEKAFGFKRVVLGIDVAEYANLYTFPLDASEWGDLTNQYITTPTGLKFKKSLEAETLIFFTRGILFDDLFSNAELTATLLHEIGHNFEDAVIPIKQSFRFIGKSLNLFTNMNISSLKSNISELFKDGSNIISKPIDFVLNFFKSKPKLLLDLKKNKDDENYNYIKSGVMSNNGYLREKFADHFATMYGYGPELSAALSKIESGRPAFYRILDILGVLYQLPLVVVLDYIEPHPKLSARIKNTINELNYELLNNKELSTSDRDDIQNQIDEVKKEAENYSKNGSTTSFFARKYFKFLYKILHNGDWVGSILSNLYDLDKIDQNIESRKK